MKKSNLVNIVGLVENFKQGNAASKQPDQFYLKTATGVVQCKIWDDADLYNGLEISVEAKQSIYREQIEYIVHNYKILKFTECSEKYCIEHINQILFAPRKCLATSKHIYNFLTNDKQHNIDGLFNHLINEPTDKATFLEKFLQQKWAKKSKLTDQDFEKLIREWMDKRYLLLLRFLGVDKRRINRIRKHGYNDFCHKITSNPFLIYTLDVKTCKYICRFFGIGYTQDDVRVANLARLIYPKEKKSPYQTRFPLDELGLTNEECQLLTGALDRHGLGFLDQAMYFKNTYEREKRLAETFNYLIHQAPTNSDWKNIKIGSSFGLKGKQEEALVATLKNNLTIVCGGAGVGKSKVISVLCKVLEDNKIDYQCCALTGKAVSSLKTKLAEYIKNPEVINKRVATIHKIIMMSGKGRTDYYNDLEDKLDNEDPDTDYADTSYEKKAQYLIFDESSMIPGLLLSRLLECYPTNTKIVFVGDNAQLAPFGGWGQPFNVLIKDKATPIVTLDVNLRLDVDGQILNKFFGAIRTGQTPNFVSEFRPNLMVETGDINKLGEIYRRLRIDEGKQSIKIITHAGKTVIKINKLCQNINVQPLKPDASFKLYDDIMITKNNYHIGLMNGQDGSIEKIQTFCVITNKLKCPCGNCKLSYIYTLYINDKPYDIILKNASFNVVEVVDGSVCAAESSQTELDVSLAYATTAHKAQGSEWTDIIIMLDSIGYINRDWFYTANTRTKSRLYIICKNLSDLNIIIRRDPEIPLNWLADFIEKKKDSSEAKILFHQKTQREEYGNSFFHSYYYPGIQNKRYVTEDPTCDGQYYDGLFSFDLDGLSYSIYIEYDGEQHFDPENSYQMAMDNKKTMLAIASGKSLIRVTVMYEEEEELPELKPILEKTISYLVNGYQIIFAIDYELNDYNVYIYLKKEYISHQSLAEYVIN